MNDKSIKDILTKRRKSLGLTMKQVAETVGVSEGTISRWESGKIADMRRDKILAYANALKISPAAIMGCEGDSPHACPATVGQRIKYRRMELGISVEEFSRRLGKNRATVYRYENDGIKDLPFGMLETLANVLMTSPSALMGFSSEVRLRPDEEALLSCYNKLNDTGREEAVNRIGEMTEIKKYRQKE